MSINKEKPHFHIIVEDDANRQILNGFANCLNVKRDNFKITTERGWLSVVEKVKNDYIPKLRKYSHGRVLMIIDFDNEVERRRSLISKELGIEFENRIFTLGVKTEPEDFRKKIRQSFEVIGKNLAENCPGEPSTLWNDELLVHNRSELARMGATDMWSILFYD
jgi:hypothetical protein